MHKCLIVYVADTIWQARAASKRFKDVWTDYGPTWLMIFQHISKTLIFRSFCLPKMILDLSKSIYVTCLPWQVPNLMQTIKQLTETIHHENPNKEKTKFQVFYFP